MSGIHRRPVRVWLVLLIAFGAVLGHVLPAHGHADEIAPAGPGAGAQGKSEDHAIYRVSREAPQPTPAQLAPNAVVSSVIAPLAPARVAARVSAPVFRADSPPLFLLHAALLI